MKKLKKIKNKLISRQIGMAKLAIKTGTTIYKNRDQGLKEQLKSGIDKYAEDIVAELSTMKGSFMKAGQLLSLLGGSFLPKETQRLLKTLESKSSFLDWKQMQKQVPEKWREELEIDETPIAAASLGQVHLASKSKDDEKFILKIQYKGVNKAIKNDIKALRFFLNTLNLIPKELDLSSVYLEVETMLVREMNYIEEAKSIKRFQRYLQKFPQFIVPSVIDEYSNNNCISLEYIQGHSLHDLEELNLSQDQRNYLGREFFRLLFLELFHFEEIQTDSHFGNYILVTEPKLAWGLLDFGAVKAPPKHFVEPYRQLILSLRSKDRDGFITNLKDMGYISKTKPSDLDLFWRYASLIGEPFYTDEYDWGASNISDQIYEYIPQIAKTISVGNPPPHSLFIDRKIAGVYFILHKLKAKFDVNKVLEEVLAENF